MSGQVGAGLPIIVTRVSMAFTGGNVWNDCWAKLPKSVPRDFGMRFLRPGFFVLPQNEDTRGPRMQPSKLIP